VDGDWSSHGSYAVQQEKAQIFNLMSETTSQVPSQKNFSQKNVDPLTRLAER
jgi:hypothetical protein